MPVFTAVCPPCRSILARVLKSILSGSVKKNFLKQKRIINCLLPSLKNWLPRKLQVLFYPKDNKAEFEIPPNTVSVFKERHENEIVI